jgi:phosphopantetheinyl transferase
MNAVLPTAARAGGPPECRVWLFRAAPPTEGARPRGRVWTRAVRHRLARACVARYLRLPRSQVQISHTAQGQPVVELLWDSNRKVALSLSDSGDTLAVAVLADTGTNGGPPPRLGIDIEAWQGRPVAATGLPWLAPRETAAIAAAPETSRREHFVAIWTQKEACLKALGLGLDAGLARFEVQPDPARPAGAHPIHPSTAAWPSLHLQRLPTAQLAGALASDRTSVHIHLTQHRFASNHRSTKP